MKRIDHYFCEDVRHSDGTLLWGSRLVKKTPYAYRFVTVVILGDDLYSQGYDITERLQDNWLSDYRCKLITNMLPAKR